MKPRKSHLSGSVSWANGKLRFGIKLLKGLVCSQSFDRALSDTVSIRWNLANAGFWWQAERLDNWIHAAKKKGDFLGSSAWNPDDSTSRVGETCVQKDNAEGDLRRKATPQRSEGEVSHQCL